MLVDIDKTLEGSKMRSCSGLVRRALKQIPLAICAFLARLNPITLAIQAGPQAEAIKAPKKRPCVGDTYCKRVQHFQPIVSPISASETTTNAVRSAIKTLSSRTNSWGALRTIVGVFHGVFRA